MNEFIDPYVVIDMSMNRLRLRFNVVRSDSNTMERTSLSLRLALTLIFMSAIPTLSHQIGEKIALKTSPNTAMQADPIIQGRRTVMERIAHGRLVHENDPARGEEIILSVYQDARDPVLRERAGELLVDLATDAWPDDHRRAFLSRIAPAALNSGRTQQLPPSIIMAQAIQESGWGRSRLATQHNNLFGVKATGAQSSVALPTLEHGPKGVHIVRARFRSYEDMGESLAHHSKLLATDIRYASAMSHRQNWRAFLSEMAPTYASDPMYTARITQLVETYKLDRWDSLCDRQTAFRVKQT